MKSVWEVASAWARTTNEDEHGETASVDEYDVNKYAFAVYIFLLVELNKILMLPCYYLYWATYESVVFLLVLRWCVPAWHP